MSSIEPYGRRSIETLIDRMVDGCLSPADLREAVSQLDTHPEGWRISALAFLEAQCWRDAFQQVGAHDDDQTVRVSSVSNDDPAPRTAVPRRRWAGPARAAAIALVAFAVGWMGHRLSTRGGGLQPSHVLPVSATNGMEAVHRDTPVPALRTASLSPEAIAGLPTDRLPTVREVARLRIGTGDAAPAEIPILAGAGVGQRWLLEQPPPFSEHDVAVWERQGYELQQTRRLMSVPLADGRRATVPIDHVQLRYVGRDPL